MEERLEELLDDLEEGIAETLQEVHAAAAGCPALAVVADYLDRVSKKAFAWGARTGENMAFLGIMSEAAKLDWARAANTLNNEKWEPHSEEMLFRAMQIPRTPEMEKSPAFQLLLLEMAAVVADALEDPCPGNDIKAALVAQHVGVDMDALRVVRLEHIRAKLQERGVRTDSLPDVMEVVRKESPHLPHEGVCLVARAVVGEDDE